MQPNDPKGFQHEEFQHDHVREAPEPDDNPEIEPLEEFTEQGDVDRALFTDADIEEIDFSVQVDEEDHPTDAMGNLLEDGTVEQVDEVSS